VVLVSDPIYVVFVGSVLFFPLLNGVGAIVCIYYRRLSKWLVLVTIGFLGQGVFSSCILMSPLVVWRGKSPGELTGMLILGNVIAILMMVLIVWGLTMTCADVWRKLRRLHETVDETRPWEPAPMREKSWEIEKEGGHDIQQ
jgi:hypothetical protein